MSAPIFSATPRLQAGIAALNAVEPSRLRLLINRIATHIQQTHQHQETSAFTEVEEAKLESSLGLSSQDIRLVLETCTYLLHQAAYHVMKPDVLSQQLKTLDLEQARIAVVASVWSASARAIIESLRNRSVLPQQLSDTSWQLHLETSSENASRSKVPHALLQLALQNSDSSTRNVVVDMNLAELQKFYLQLERIQAQLDSLK